jgi:glycosyltransferase involved in cell wall biosynthesis
MLKLTQCLIVKNEEHNLTRALSWGKALFDEQIVVDTGSSDGTVVLAEKLGARVLHFDWIDDFSAARNFAISQCTGDWIFFLDADEYFEDTDVPLLLPVIEMIDGLCISENGKKLCYNVVETPWINGEDNKISRQSRIFRNVPYLRYAGELHEQLHAMPGGCLKVYSIKDKPAIYHKGYIWSKDNSKAAKGARNFEVARKAIEKNPNCAKFKLFAAEALMDQKKYGEAESYFFEAMKNRDGSIWPERAGTGYKQLLKNYLLIENSESEASGILGKALLAYHEAAAKFPDDPDFDILISLLYFKAKDIKNTIYFFNASLSKNSGKLTESIIPHDKYESLRAICENLKKLNIV